MRVSIKGKLTHVEAFTTPVLEGEEEPARRCGKPLTTACRSQLPVNSEQVQPARC